METSNQASGLAPGLQRQQVPPRAIFGGPGAGDLGSHAAGHSEKPGANELQRKAGKRPKNAPTFILFLPDLFFYPQLISIAYICVQAQRYETDFFGLFFGLFGLIVGAV
jgi:hypothetical protein